MSGYGSLTDTYGSLTILYGDTGATTGGGPVTDPGGPVTDPTDPNDPGTPDASGGTEDPATPPPVGPCQFSPPLGEDLPSISMWPPTIRANPLGTALMAHFKGYAQAVNVWKLADGTYTQQQPIPAIVNFSPVPANQRIVHVYRGGTVETVSSEEAQALRDAGYDVDCGGVSYDTGVFYDSGAEYG